MGVDVPQSAVTAVLKEHAKWQKQLEKRVLKTVRVCKQAITRLTHIITGRSGPDHSFSLQA